MNVKKTIQMIDSALPGARIKDGLIVLYFHKLFADNSVIPSEVDTQQNTRVLDFRKSIEYFLEKGYSFVSVDDLSILESKKYVMITFDDGYYNNSLALPALTEYGVPALFFVSTGHVQNREAYWWDILHRRVSNPNQRKRIKRNLKTLNPNKTKDFLLRNFGKDSLSEMNEHDRPFTEDELKDFARQKFVTIGSHTVNHANLAYCSLSEIQYELSESKRYLESILGRPTNTLSYPNGSVDDRLYETAKAAGYDYGFTTNRGYNDIALAEFAFRIKRYIFPDTTGTDFNKLMGLIEKKHSLYNSCVQLYSSLL